MANKGIKSAQIYLPLSTGGHTPHAFDSFKGKWWVSDTSYYGQKPHVEMDSVTYRSMVESAVAAIQSGLIEKVVLSRMISCPSPALLDTKTVMNRLCQTYSSACVFQFELTDGEEWMGATPEKLIVKRGQKWQTLALAGTRKMANKTDWTDKELHEQGVVKDYIINILTSNGAHSIEVGNRHDREAGPLVHLANEIVFESDESVEFWAQKLHPTPAVCGLPQKQAMDYILQHEPHSRGFYTGLIGLEHLNGDADVYVILRCIQRISDGFRIYVGGGITTGSAWNDEFNETEAKADVIRDVLVNAWTKSTL